ncbi:MAG: Ig-like domain-containing protein, partial [Thermoplasmatota archaeon]
YIVKNRKMGAFKKNKEGKEIKALLRKFKKEGCPEWTHDGENWTRLDDVSTYEFTSPLEAGSYSIIVRCVDKAGNWAEDTVDIIIDLTPPTLWIISPSGDGFYRERKIEIVYSSFDDLTNISQYQVRIDTDDWIHKGSAKSHNFTNLQDGKHHLYVKSIDGAGNEEIVSTTGTVDLSPPEMTILNLVQGQLYNKPITLEWEAWDDISEVALTRISLDGGEWMEYSSPRPVVLDLLGDGSHYLNIEVLDMAGNLLERNISFEYDGSAPVISFVSPGGTNVAVNSSISITFSELMDPDSVVIDSPGISGRKFWRGDNLTLVPDEDLEYSKKYSIAVTGRDLAGNDMIPFDWFFVTEEDLSLRYGRVHGRVVNTNGVPIPYAGFRFKTGEKGECDLEGRFDIYVTTGENFIIVSNTSYHDTKVDFEVYEGEVENLGDIPLRSEAEVEEEKEKGSNTLLAAIIIALVAVIVIAVGAGIGYQVKKTRDYNRMGPVVDEWVNVTDLKSPTKVQSTSNMVRRTHQETIERQPSRSPPLDQGSFQHRTDRIPSDPQEKT